MINCRISVPNSDDFIDTEVFIDIKLSCCPRRGETLFLSEPSLRKLEDMVVKTNREIYYDRYMDEGKVSFDEGLFTVHDICYYENENRVYIILANIDLNNEE